MWANIGVPSSDVPAEVELLHMRIEHHDSHDIVSLGHNELNFAQYNTIHIQIELH